MDGWMDGWRMCGLVLAGQWGHWLSAALDFTPTLDNKWVPSQLIAGLENGLLDPNVSVLVGSNQDEGATFVYAAFNVAIPVPIFDLALKGIFGESGSKAVRAFYKNQTPGSQKADCREVLSAILTDYWFRCASQKIATAAIKNGNKGCGF